MNGRVLSSLSAPMNSTNQRHLKHTKLEHHSNELRRSVNEHTVINIFPLYPWSWCHLCYQMDDWQRCVDPSDWADLHIGNKSDECHSDGQTMTSWDDQSVWKAPSIICHQTGLMPSTEPKPVLNCPIATGDHCYLGSSFLSSSISFCFVHSLCNCMVRDPTLFCFLTFLCRLSLVWPSHDLGTGILTQPPMDIHSLWHPVWVSELINVVIKQFSYRAQHCILTMLHFLAKLCLVCLVRFYNIILWFVTINSN